MAAVAGYRAGLSKPGITSRWIVFLLSAVVVEVLALVLPPVAEVVAVAVAVVLVEVVVVVAEVVPLRCVTSSPSTASNTCADDGWTLIKLMRCSGGKASRVLRSKVCENGAGTRAAARTPAAAAWDPAALGEVGVRGGGAGAFSRRNQ